MISLGSQTESPQLRRDLRARISRVRRRIDQRLGLVRSSGARWGAWRDYVVRSPLVALLAALVAGLSLSAGLGRKADEKDGPAFPVEEACRFARWVMGKLWSRFHSPAAATTPERQPAEAEGGEDGGT